MMYYRPNTYNHDACSAPARIACNAACLEEVKDLWYSIQSMVPSRAKLAGQED